MVALIFLNYRWTAPWNVAVMGTTTQDQNKDFLRTAEVWVPKSGRAV